jgi:uncharacterized protein YjbI with pentapeptide repeats
MCCSNQKEISKLKRDEALKLLTGGEAGVREWDQRRESGEEIPDLSGANLRHAILRRGFCEGANFSGADFSGADLSQANLSHANLIGANLSTTDLRSADLCDAKLCHANLSEANLGGAFLISANFSHANLSGANLSLTSLERADFRGANLNEVSLVRSSMLDVDLRGAKLNNCRVYGASVWSVKTDDQTEQSNLILGNPSDHTEPLLTVDNLKVAQFIHLLVHNEEIRGVIDTITSKVVLILGRFTPERKELLDAIRDELRRRNYLPILFDFNKPASRGYTETITTLARMARFIIADLTDAMEVRLELAKIVPDLPSVPVKPILLNSEPVYTTFSDLKPYTWVLAPFRYKDLDHAIASVPKMILAPAEAKVRKMRV